MRLVAVAVIGLAVTSGSALTQTAGNTSWPPAGTRVRVQSQVLGVERQVGTIESVAGDTLHFRRAEDGASAALTPSRVSRGKLLASGPGVVRVMLPLLPPRSATVVSVSLGAPAVEKRAVKSSPRPVSASGRRHR